ncbi:FAD-dependent thymidylate synthase [Brevibacterium sp. CFH 10365]|uniref:FAD-dependent thymidylate synthase n=1 Tax=Brevibacterium sp. CFH 10365 TaxID=2585207 RepID=UPI0018792EFA|nr:FAD-dependent thymidylate synthase [Brevibacterium sp. CFH 10365]
MGVELIEAWGSDRKVAQSARVSTLGLDNDREKIAGLVKALWRDGHYSPFESSGMTIAFDVPMFVRDQLVRHKSFSFSVKSLRYSEAAPKFFVPDPLRPLVQVGKALDYRREEGTALQRKITAAIIKSNAKQSWDSYQYMINLGICDEVARSVLPTSLFTQLWMTGSLRSWLHFLDQRDDPHAQFEIQEAAGGVRKILGENYPVTHDAWKATKGNS